MKSVNLKESLNIEKHFQVLKKARLQDILCSHQDILTAFYQNSQIFYLWFDLSSSRPIALTFNERPKDIDFTKKVKPMGLFLKAHFKGRFLEKIYLEKKKGRVFIFEFDDGSSWEFRFFTGGQNFIAKSQKKSISWSKPHPLPETSESFLLEKEERSIQELTEEWKKNRQKANSLSKAKNLKQENRIEGKRKKALSQITEQLKKYEHLTKDNIYRRFCQFIESKSVPKTWDKVSIPEEFRPLLKKNKTPAETLQETYKKSKNLRHKIDRLKERKKELERPQKLTSLSEKKDSDLFSQSQTKGKKRIFENCSCWVGRSAKDNLRLLRYAKPWYFWLHLKDYPGAHGIIRRDKKQKLSEEQLYQACQFFLKESLKSKTKQGEKFDVLICEVRFVQPLKGDRLGRVKVQREKVMTIKYDHGKMNT